MSESFTVSDLLTVASVVHPLKTALIFKDEKINYLDLYKKSNQFSSGLIGLGLSRGDRIGIYQDKSFETVIACFGASLAGCIFVPINPLLKPDQVGHILNDCNVRLLITNYDRYVTLNKIISRCQDLMFVVLSDQTILLNPVSIYKNIKTLNWIDLISYPSKPGYRVIDSDVASIFYTSGSTGKPKGVVLSHRNMVVGAKSVVTYLENIYNDIILSVLPLSFDAGFSQLTTAFHVGATVVLFNYLLPRDVLNVIDKESITCLTAVPPLYIQLARLDWPIGSCLSLRYFANTGGRMPLDVLTVLRVRLPCAKPFLMYGLTESFRSTYLHPSEIDNRPDSIGKAIPNAEICVIREDGLPCAVNEPGELVHRGALVGLGYWNDPVKTAERFKLLTTNFPGRPSGLQLPEYVVHSGDTVRQDEDGFLYFIGRKDEMIKVSGYRISPTEIEEILYSTQGVGECVAFGIDHPLLGSAIQVIATQAHQHCPITELALIKMCRQCMPAYMVPSGIDFLDAPLPRNPNGKIDRVLLIAAWKEKSLLRSGQSAIQSLREAH